MTFKELYDNVAERVNPEKVNKFVSTGNTMAIIESASGNVYYGVSIDAANGLGMSAERSAIATMITYGEVEIAKMVVVGADGSLQIPTGDSRELMLQLSSSNADAEILIDADNTKIVRLNKLLPLWWGTNKY